jgi:hypothetical protein
MRQNKVRQRLNSDIFMRIFRNNVLKGHEITILQLLPQLISVALK